MKWWTWVSSKIHSSHFTNVFSLCSQTLYIRLTGPPALLKVGVLGALLLLNFSLYCGAAVHGVWLAGVATIMKKGGDAFVWLLIKLTACRF